MTQVIVLSDAIMFSTLKDIHNIPRLISNTFFRFHTLEIVTHYKETKNVQPKQTAKIQTLHLYLFMFLNQAIKCDMTSFSFLMYPGEP